jgi:5-oxoprolinase (ATP-hydrolysing) subunit A
MGRCVMSGVKCNRYKKNNRGSTNSTSLNRNQIDINCDMGESFGQFKVGNDEAVFPYITSCSIACGFHGGDANHMERTVTSAIARGVRIGAHPSYPDLAGFGRKKMQLSSKELNSIIKYQVSALRGMTDSLGGQLEYVKPHGALYNTIAGNREEAKTVYEAIREVDPSLMVMGLAGSIAAEIAQELGLQFIAEAFADRTYRADGTLTSRSEEGAVISDADESVVQVLSIILDKHVVTSEGITIPMHADSICIHGDNPAAVDILRALDEALEMNHILKRNQDS